MTDMRFLTVEDNDGITQSLYVDSSGGSWQGKQVFTTNGDTWTDIAPVDGTYTYGNGSTMWIFGGQITQIKTAEQLEMELKFTELEMEIKHVSFKLDELTGAIVELIKTMK